MPPARQCCTIATDPLVIPASILGHNTPGLGIPTLPLEQQNSLNVNGYTDTLRWLSTSLIVRMVWEFAFFN